MNEERVGYARVSTKGQNIESQIDSLKRSGCKRVYSDKKSGKNLDREQWNECRDYLRKGDTLVVTTLERLGRDLIEVVQLIEELYDQGVRAESLSHPIDWESAHGRFIVGITLLVAQFERELMLEKQKRGLEYAKSQGRTGGRKKGVRLYDVDQIVSAYKSTRKELKHGKACAKVGEEFNISPATVARYAESKGAYRTKKRKK